MRLMSKIPELPPNLMAYNSFWPINRHTDISLFWQITPFVFFFMVVILIYWRFYLKSRFDLKYRAVVLTILTFLVTCCVCTVFIYLVERPVNENFSNIYETMWSIFLYLTSRLAGRAPITFAGRIITSILLFLSTLLTATVTALIAARFIIKKLEGRMKYNKKDHILILNWNNRAIKILDQIHSPGLEHSERLEVVVLSNNHKVNQKDLTEKYAHKYSKNVLTNVLFHTGDPTDSLDLEKYNAVCARTIIILGDDSIGEYADDKSFRTLLAIQKLYVEQNKKAHVVLELLNMENLDIYETLKVNFPGQIDCIAQGEMRSLLLAQASIIPDLTHFYRDLLSFETGDSNELYLLDIPKNYFNGNDSLMFTDCATMIMKDAKRQPIIPVGIQKNDNGIKRLVTNPRQYIDDTARKKNEINKDFFVNKEDKLLVITYDKPDQRSFTKVTLKRNLEEITDKVFQKS